jgi:3-oxoacyl-[acyl-carrier-protein] synthase-3
MNKLRRAAIIGTGSYVPMNIRSNKEVEATSGTSPNWALENLGINERHIVAEGELNSDMAAVAALRSIEASGLKPEDIELIILATATPDRLAPSTACIVQKKIGAFNAAAFDMNAVCAGYMFAMATAVNYIVAMGYTNVLVIGVDCFSRFTDWSRRDAVFFGDGAGASVLALSTDASGFGAFKLGSDGRGQFNFTINGGGSEMLPHRVLENPGQEYFQMDAKEVYKVATRVLPEAINAVLMASQMTIDEIDHLLPHQASMTVLTRVAEVIGIPLERVRTNMKNYANTSSATIPILLDETVRSGQIKKNQFGIFAAVGSGWAWGAALYRF